MASKGEKLVKNTAILSFGTLCTKGIMFIMTPLFTHWLSQNEYGTFDLLITYIALLIPLITLDCGEAAFRFLTEIEDENDKRRIVSSALVVSLLGLLIAGMIFGVVFICYEPSREILPYFVLLLICEAVNNFLTFLVRGFKRLPIYAVSNILFVFSMAIMSFIFVKVCDLGIGGIFLAYSMGYFVSIVFSCVNIKVQKYIEFHDFDIKTVKDMLKFSLPLVPTAIAWWIINISDRTIVSLNLGMDINAVYAVANKIPNLCQTIFGVFHLSWQESAVETLHDEARDEYYSNVMNNMSKVLGSICVVILAINFIFFEYNIFSSDYYAAYYQVPILVVALIFSMLAQFIGGINIAKMESKKNGVTTALAAIINLIVHLSLIKFIGLYAATISTLVAYICLFTVRFVDIKKDIRLKFDKQAICTFIVISYFFVCVYINLPILNYINLVLSLVYFLVSNFHFIIKLVKKFKKKDL